MPVLQQFHNTVGSTKPWAYQTLHNNCKHICWKLLKCGSGNVHDRKVGFVFCYC